MAKPHDNEDAQEDAKEKAPRFFDAVEYTAKLNEALDKLKKEKKPGQMSGKVGKSEILKSGAVKMQELLDAGYTLKQISDAISEDVFGILPKSLTEILGRKKENPAKRARKSNPPAAQPVAPPAAPPAAQPAGVPAAPPAAPPAAQQNKQIGKSQITQVGDLP